MGKSFDPERPREKNCGDSMNELLPHVVSKISRAEQRKIDQKPHLTGIQESTEWWAKKGADGIWEVRVGIAIIGTDDKETDCPFDDSFRGNYAAGRAITLEQAKIVCFKEMKRDEDSLWA